MADWSGRTLGMAALSGARRGSLRGAARGLMERQAAVLIEQAGSIDVSTLTGALSFTARVPAPSTRHDWSLHLPDQLALQALVVGREMKKAFEIGTFNGGTTRVIAEALPDGGRVWTLDLPPADFDASQSPEGFAGSNVGREYRASAAVEKITQILCDSTTYDPGSLEGEMDLVLVDGAHDYQHGLSDTRLAYRLVAPGGTILWDDFVPYWHGLVRGIYQAAAPQVPRRLAGSNLGVWTANS